METGTPSRKLDLSFFLFLALSAVAVTMCYDFLFIPAMVVLPALWAAAAFKGKFGAPVFLGLSAFTIGYGLAIGYDLLFTLRILILALPSPVLLYLAHKYKLGNTQAALYLSVTVTFGLFAIFCMNSLLQGLPAFSEVRSLFLSMLSSLESVFGSENPLIDPFVEYVNNIDIYFPSVLYSFGATYALTNVLLLQLFNKRKKAMPLVPVRPFSEWRLSRPYVLVCVLVMAVSLFVSYSGSPKAEMILLLSNYMLNMPLTVVGAGTLYGLFTRSGKTPVKIILYVVLIVVLTAIGLSLYTLSILGFLKSTGFRRPPKKA